MKKLLSLLLVAIMSLTVLTGCGDPIFDDLQNFLNVEMVNINADYTKITEEVGKWETYEDDNGILTSINETLLPLVNGSLDALKDINPETEEVKEIKNKYVKVMDAYKEGFEGLAEGCETQDETTINTATEKLGEAVSLLDEYNKALEDLAAQYGSEIEY